MHYMYRAHNPLSLPVPPAPNLLDDTNRRGPRLAKPGTTYQRLARTTRFSRPKRSRDQCDPYHYKYGVAPPLKKGTRFPNGVERGTRLDFLKMDSAPCVTYRGSPHLRKSGKVDRYLYLLKK